MEKLKSIVKIFKGINVNRAKNVPINPGKPDIEYTGRLLGWMTLEQTVAIMSSLKMREKIETVETQPLENLVGVHNRPTIFADKRLVLSAKTKDGRTTFTNSLIILPVIYGIKDMHLGTSVTDMSSKETKRINTASLETRGFDLIMIEETSISK